MHVGSLSLGQVVLLDEAVWRVPLMKTGMIMFLVMIFDLLIR